MEQIGYLTRDEDGSSGMAGGVELIPVVVGRPNMLKAYSRVLRDRCAPGMHSMDIADSVDYLKGHCAEHQQELL